MKDITLIGIALTAGFFIGKDAAKRNIAQQIEQGYTDRKKVMEKKVRAFIETHVPDLDLEERLLAAEEITE